MLLLVSDVMGALAFYILKKLGSDGNRLTDGLVEVLTGFVLAKKLFAHKKHSNTKPVSFDVLVVTLARAYLLAILNGIAAKWHSGAVPISVLSLVFRESLLHHFHHFFFGKELVRPPLDVSLGELYGSL